MQELGPSFLSTILGNTYNKLLFKPSDPQTTKAWAEMMGRQRVFERTVSEQQSRSKAFDFLGLGLNAKVTHAQSETHARREREEYRLSVERLARLDVGQAVLLHGATQLFDLRIPKLSFLPQMKQELGGVVIQRPVSKLKPARVDVESLKIRRTAPQAGQQSEGQWVGNGGLYFYKKYERFLTELAPLARSLASTQEETRRTKFQKLGGLSPLS